MTLQSVDAKKVEPVDTVKMELVYKFKILDRVRLMCGRRLRVSLRAPTRNKVELMEGAEANMTIEEFGRVAVLGVAGLAAGVMAAVATWMMMR